MKISPLINKIVEDHPELWGGQRQTQPQTAAQPQPQPKPQGWGAEMMANRAQYQAQHGGHDQDFANWMKAGGEASGVSFAELLQAKNRPVQTSATPTLSTANTRQAAQSGQTADQLKAQRQTNDQQMHEAMLAGNMDVYRSLEAENKEIKARLDAIEAEETKKRQYAEAMASAQQAAEAKSRGQSYDEWYNAALAQNETAAAAEKELKRRLQAAKDQRSQGYWDNGVYMGEDHSRDQEIAQMEAELKRLQNEASAARDSLRYAGWWRYEDLPQMQDYARQVQAGRNAFRTEEKPESNQAAINAAIIADSANPYAAGYLMAQDYYRTDTSYREPGEGWTMQQKNNFYYLYGKDREEAYAYAQGLNDQLAYQKRMAEMQKASDWAQQNGWTGLAGTGGSILTAPFALVDYVDRANEYAARGTITQRDYASFADYGDAMESGVAEKLNELSGTVEDGVLEGKGLGDVYQLGVGTIQSVTYGNLLGPFGQAAVAFGEASKSGMDDAIQRGATPEQALLFGTMCGLSEAAGEYFSIDKLLSMKNPETLSQFFLSFLKQGGVEASENDMTTLINTVSDAWIMGDKSEIALNVQGYMRQGMTEEEAQKQAMKDWMNGVAWDTIGGFASGGFASTLQQAGQSAFSRGRQAAQERAEWRQAGRLENEQREALEDIRSATMTEHPLQNIEWIWETLHPEAKENAAGAQAQQESTTMPPAAQDAQGAASPGLQEAEGYIINGGERANPTGLASVDSAGAFSPPGSSMPGGMGGEAVASPNNIISDQNRIVNALQDAYNTRIKVRGEEYGIGDLSNYVEWLYEKYGEDTLDGVVSYLTGVQHWPYRDTMSLIGAAQASGAISVDRGGAIKATPEYAASLYDKYFVWKTNEAPSSAPDGTSALAGDLDTVADNGAFGNGSFSPGTAGNSGGSHGNAYAPNNSIPNPNGNVNGGIAPGAGYGRGTKEASPYSTKSGFTANNAATAGQGKASGNSILNRGRDVNGNLREIGELGQAAREAGVDMGMVYNALGEDYGTIPAGEKAARAANVPTSISGDDGVSRTARTIMEAEATPEGRLLSLRDAVVDGKFSYIPTTNAELENRAAEKIKRYGWRQSLTDWTAAVRSGKSNEELTAMGAVLLNNAGNSDMTGGEYVTLATDYHALTHGQARGLAAQRILKSLSPEGRLYGVLRSVDAINEQTQKKYNIEVPAALVEEYRAQTTDKGRDAVIDKIQQSVADQIPTTALDAFTAFRYVNMLGNFKTQLRNVVGNLASAALSKAKDVVKVGVEELASAVTKGKYEKTASLYVNNNLRKEALSDAAALLDELRGDGKYADESRRFERGIQDKRTIFKINGDFGKKATSNTASRAARWAADLGLAGLEKYRRATNFAMETGDAIFLKHIYADKLGGYLQANGIKSMSEASPALLDRARAYAIREAQEATFRDSNRISDWVSKIGRRPDTPGWAKAVSEGVAPFRKTPANVAIRAVEYSPLGLGEAVIQGLQVKSGKYTAADVINTFSKGATGSVLFLAGVLMKMAGRARGSEDDDKLDQFQKMQGQQDYSISIGGANISLSQLAPSAVPFFMGVEFAKAIEDDGRLTLDDIPTVLGAVSGPMLEMSMLGGINDTLSDLGRYGNDSPALFRLFANAYLSYLTQGLTSSFSGQIEQAGEEYRQTSYTDPESLIPQFLQYPLSKAMGKIPGKDYNQQDYIDAWGRRQSNGDPTTRILNAFANPLYYGTDRSTKVDAELERLYEAGKNLDGFPNVLPQRAARTLEYAEGKRMTPEEYQQYSIDRGQMSLKLVSDFMSSAEYRHLSDQQRAEVISDLYTLAADRAMKKVKTANGVEYTGDWEKAAGLSEPVEYLSYKQALSDAGKETANTAMYKSADSLLRQFEMLPRDVQRALKEDSGLHVRQLEFAAGKGISSEEWYDTYEAIRDARVKTGSQAQAVTAAAVARAVSGNEAEKLEALEAQLPPENGTGKRQAIVRRYETAMSMGASFDQWTRFETTLKDLNEDGGTPKKAEIYQAAAKAGLNGDTVYLIYKKYYDDADYVTLYDENYAADNPAAEKEAGISLTAYLDGYRGVSQGSGQTQDRMDYLINGDRGYLDSITPKGTTGSGTGAGLPDWIVEALFGKK